MMDSTDCLYYVLSDTLIFSCKMLTKNKNNWNSWLSIAITVDESFIRADIAPSALETFCLMGYISLLIYLLAYLMTLFDLERQFTLSSELCVL